MITKFDIGQIIHIDRKNPYFLEGKITAIEIDRDTVIRYHISFGTKDKPAFTVACEEDVYLSKNDMLQSSLWATQMELF